jgi:hypothetical protein
MKAYIALTALLTLLAGCATHEQKAAEQAANDDTQCQSYGAKPATDPYIQCRVSLSQQHAQADQARKQRAIQALQNYQSPTSAQPMPVNTYQLPTTVNCTSTTFGQTTNTSCR